MPPVLTSLYPDGLLETDPNVANITVTLTGTGFEATSVVEWDGVAVTPPPEFISVTELTVIAPAGITGSVDVVVKNVDLSTSNALQFTYYAEIPACDPDATTDEQNNYNLIVGAYDEVEDLNGNRFLLSTDAAMGYDPVASAPVN